MPIYHFHSADGERIPDREGSELENDARARTEAVRYAGAVLSHDPNELWKTGHWRVEVTDENNDLLFTVITLAVDAAKRGAPEEVA